jgi:hypothetical protein
VPPVLRLSAPLGDAASRNLSDNRT